MSYTTGMTVQELINQLEKEDPASPVATEGCDCYGPADGVGSFMSEGHKVVLITRKED